MSTVGGREWFVDRNAPGWLAARRYAMPTAMLAAATARRLAGDWRGACAAARVDVAFELDEVRVRRGTEVAAQVEDDLVHLAPDLVRWHAPRTEPRRAEAGWLDSRRQITLANYGDGLRLWVATEPLLYRPQRLTLHCAPHGVEGVEDWRHAPYLWDARAAHLLLRRLGGGDRTPFFHRDGTPLSTVELIMQDPTDPVTLRERTMALTDDGSFVAAWAASGIRLDPPRLDNQLEPKVALLVAMVPELGPHVRARLAHPSSTGAIVLRDGPRTGHSLVLRLVEGELAARHDYDREFQQHAVLPRPLWQRFPDLELLRTGRITAAQVHPLVRAAMFPDQPDPGYDPRLPTVDSSGVTIECAGRHHRIGWHAGRITAFGHSAEETSRERSLGALGAKRARCVVVLDAWRDREAGRLPPSLVRLRDHCLAIMWYGDIAAFREILDAGIDPTGLRDSQGRGPLDHLAHFADGTVLLRRLLDAGFDLAARDGMQRTPLANVLADGGSAELVRAILDAGADPLATDKYDTSMLHLVCARDARPIIGWLVDAGADLEARNQLGWPPMAQQLANWAPAETIRAMLDAGADPGQADPHGHQSLVEALTGRDDLDFLVEAAAATGVDLTPDGLRRSRPGWA